MQSLTTSIVKYIKDPEFRFNVNTLVGINSFLPDKYYLKKKYRVFTGHPLNLDNPQTFNEKLQWLKIYDRRPEYTIIVDKYRVREIVASTIGEEYLVPLLGVWNDPDEIQFKKLPNQFVLKCNHNSGTGMCICREKSTLDIEKVKVELRKALSQDYYISGREWPYKDVPRKIICEKYLEDTTIKEVENQGLNDYKFFCFSGKVKFFKVDFDRFTEHHANYYNPEGMLLEFGEADYPPRPDRKIQLPDNLLEMEHLAEILAKDYPFLRVDFYNIKGRIFFGELTLFPTSGFGKWTDDSWDLRLGELIHLPIK